MTGYHSASSALTLLVLMMGASFLHLANPSPVNTSEEINSPNRNSPHGLTVLGNGVEKDEERQSLEKNKAEREEDLFKDVDPKTLAAVLLEALNRSQVERREEEQEGEGMEGEIEAERLEGKNTEEYRQVRTMEGADRDRDRDRDRRPEIELLMAAQGKEQERKEEEERKKAQEEEEQMTEKVTSRTTSQTVQVQTEQQSTSPDGQAENRKEAGSQQRPTSIEQGGNEEEEQLSPEELKSLETMMKEFPRLDTATKRKVDSEPNQRESRGYSNNDIIPINKGINLAMSNKKLKWQEETQKALNVPSFREGNFMDDFEDGNYGNNAAESRPPAEQEVMEEDEPEEEEREDEEVLSPEEEEARAKAEQEEMRRQAAEAQRAKMKEEKLADIASDMLLRYMVKQNNGNKKYSLSLSNAAEDKRSNEEQEVTEEDDIDPQTIDKLIEISSKLHLPADDVVDIISDVEKKKKKDLPPELTSHWQQPLTPPSSSFSSKVSFSPSQIAAGQNNLPVSKQSSPAVGLLKTWFQDKTSAKPQDRWSKISSQTVWPKQQRPLSIKQGLWRQPPKSVWTGYSSYPFIYPFHYQRKPYPDYYPVYFPPPPRPNPRYFIPKPALSLNTFLGNLVDDANELSTRRRYHSWVQPRLKTPPAGHQQKPYYSSYPLTLYPRTFRPVLLPKARPPPRIPIISPQQKQMYYSAPAPPVTRKEDYYMAGKQSDSSNLDNVEKYIQKIIMNRPKMLD